MLIQLCDTDERHWKLGFVFEITKNKWTSWKETFKKEFSQMMSNDYNTWKQDIRCKFTLPTRPKKVNTMTKILLDFVAPI